MVIILALLLARVGRIDEVAANQVLRSMPVFRFVTTNPRSDRAGRAHPEPNLTGWARWHLAPGPVPSTDRRWMRDGAGHRRAKAVPERPTAEMFQAPVGPTASR
jgi:hypothetical protein